MTKRGRRWADTGRVKEDGHEQIIVLPVHYPCIELAYIDEWVKTLNGSGWPNRVNTIRKEDGPKSGRLPQRKDDDTRKRGRGGDLFPRRNQFPDRGTDESGLA